VDLPPDQSAVIFQNGPTNISLVHNSHFLFVFFSVEPSEEINGKTDLPFFSASFFYYKFIDLTAAEMSSATEKFLSSNTLSFVVQLSVGRVTTVELRNESYATGRVVEVWSRLRWASRAGLPDFFLGHHTKKPEV
jgi:hypothetical protein